MRTTLPQLLLFLSLPLFFSACTGKSNYNEVVKALEKSLISSNRSIHMSSQANLKSLEEKTTDYATKERAEIWFPKAEQVAKLSSGTYNYIEDLKKLKRIDSDKAKKLFTQLSKYKEAVLSIDSSILSEFAKNFPLLLNSSDVPKEASKDFYNTFFKKSSPILSQATLTKFQTDISITENKITAFCNSKVSSTIFTFDTYAALIGQNSNYLKPGDVLEIYAGIGAFSKIAQPKIIINGNNTEINEKGFATYKTKTSKKAGEYKIPVKVSFKNPLTGKDDTMIVDVEYTVAKQCDQ